MTRKDRTTNDNKAEKNTVIDINKTSKSAASNRNMYFKYSLLMTIFVLSFLISLYTVSPYSKINEVNVEGTVSVYDQLVFESSQLTPGDSLIEIVFNKRNIEQAVVDNNKQVRFAQLNLTGIQSVTLSVKEYDTVAFLLEDGTYRKILENGEVLEETFPRITDNQPILIGFEPGFALDRMLMEYKEVDNSVREMISEIEKIDNDRNELLIRVSLTDGNEALASIPTFSERINYYPQMRETVEGTQGLFDLEAGAYFVPFESDEYLEMYEENESGSNSREEFDENE